MFQGHQEEKGNVGLKGKIINNLNNTKTSLIERYHMIFKTTLYTDNE